ncbi:Putative NTF2-like domain superfamily protein [Septoria linicola]|uniref:NTF2-like domain superfamily protein n=1 Tax=Septoria linicola TaxID=215465 RepID=A0A9Q9EGB8_9PEZI|nr:putative NTF2-like domain superfamily protein [Septoria linicola]USW48617.1 Putative NTF2-like domain superfamily protein [Septoria linicola]
MSGKAGVYLSFLQSPSTGVLASDASIHYITTTTSINEPTAILKHIAAQAKQVVKKEEKVLYTIEGDNGCSIETQTTLSFRMGGGAFLPSMDSNMLDEREVTFPLTHIVTFDGDKIQQIRQYWDQSTLLKQVEAIGKTGRNWPIRDGRDQIKAVATSIKAGVASGGSVGKVNNGSRKPNEVVISGHQKRDSVSVTRDPHASLSLFQERDVNESNSTYTGPKYEQARSAKPAPRDLGELFTNEEYANDARSQSPHKEHGTILKAGAGKGYTENRLFDSKEDFEPPKSPERKKTYGQKYDHFAFGDGEDAPQGRTTRPKSNNAQDKSSATFSFEDFSTPPKHIEKNRPDYERHWGAGVDEDDQESPPKRPVVHQPRKDAEPHWELNDDSPAPAKVKSLQRQKGLGLYGDPLHADDRVQKAVSKPTIDNARRGNDFEAHYSLTDESPAGPKKIYKTAGDGMGSRSGGRAWGIGDESDPEVDADVRPSARSRGQRAQARSGAELDF